MRVPYSTLAATVAVLTLGACGDPPKTKDADGGSAAGGSGSATGGGAAGTGAAYDPVKDPLVNPASLTEPYDAAKATEDETFYSTLDGNPQTLNPLFASSQYEFRFNELMWHSIFTFDAKMQWKVNEDAVEKLDVSPDKKVWTVRLKQGFTWTDGTPFTAHDVVYSWQEHLDDRVPTTNPEGCKQLASVKALDDHTVEYVAKEPSPNTKWDINFSIVPKHLYDKGKAEDPTLKTSAYYAKLNREPVTNGPYRFVEWKENDKIVLDRWDAYKGTKGHFKRIVFRIIPEQNTQLLTFEKGDTDEMRLMSKQFAIETVTSETFPKVGVKSKSSQWSYNCIAWNVRDNPFFGDVRVRRAMTLATNLPKMIEKITYRIAEPSYGPFHKTSWMYNPAIELLPYDPKEAARLLDEAGWKIDPETGWRKKDGVVFSFTLTYGQGNAQTVEMATAMQQGLKAIGVEMKQQAIEWATLQERNRKHEFQASTFSWGTGVDPDLNRNIFGTKAIEEGRNYGCYSNPKLDELFEQGRVEFDDAKRARIYQEIGKILYDEQVYMFQWSMPCLWAFNKRIRGVTYSPRGVWNFEPSVMGWWVAKQDQLYK
jgi:peptide/nickel transport system substrate-binding protein